MRVWRYDTLETVKVIGQGVLEESVVHVAFTGNAVVCNTEKSRWNAQSQRHLLIRTILGMGCAQCRNLNCLVVVVVVVVLLLILALQVITDDGPHKSLSIWDWHSGQKLADGRLFVMHAFNVIGMRQFVRERGILNVDVI